MTLAAPGPEVLTRRECLSMLAERSFGRVALSASALPVVVPVPYELGTDGIVIRLDAAPSLETAMLDAVVAFEVDDLERFEEGGCSVLVTGVAKERQIDGERCVVIGVDIVSGHRIAPAAAAHRQPCI